VLVFRASHALKNQINSGLAENGEHQPETAAAKASG
jgi:hypothetical protein